MASLREMTESELESHEPDEIRHYAAIASRIVADWAAAEGALRSEVGMRDRNAEDYEDRTVGELRDRANELGVSGYSKLRKAELIEMIRKS